MTTAAEVFVLQLSRASTRANRFLRSRALGRDERKDVLATAMLWCWENRANYSLTTTLETWFLNAVRDAYKSWVSGAVRNSAESIVADIPTGDSTEAAAESRSAIQVLLRALPRAYRRVAIMLAQGLTRAEMMEKGVPERTISDARARIQQLRHLVPSRLEIQRLAPNSQGITPGAGPAHDGDRELSALDQEMERLEFAPPMGKECPPCWRCKWFEGYLPGAHRSVRMEIVERDVKAAVLKTERRKVRIAKEVRDGSI